MLPMRVRDIMIENPVCCGKETSLRQALLLMRQNDCHAIAVLDGEKSRKPVGLLDEAGILTAGSSPQLLARDIMNPEPLIVRHLGSAEHCLRLMEKRRARCGIVIDAEGRTCGLVWKSILFTGLSEEVLPTWWHHLPHIGGE